MNRSGTRTSRWLRVGTAAFCAQLLHTGVLAQDQPTARLQIEEIIVIAKDATDDLTRIAPDAASLLATPGDVNDPLKALLSLPGITFGGGDLDAPVIRGGGPGDNLYLVDGVPVENVFHELSDSILSPNAIRTFDLYSAAYGAAYGNATGGVIDIGLRDPAPDNRHLSVDISQLKSGFLVESPITGSLAAYGSYRHNLAHLFLKEFERGNDALVFQMPESRDYTARLIWRTDNTDLTYTAFGAWDKTEERPRTDSAATALLGNTETRQLDTSALRLRSRLDAQTDLTATLSHSDIGEAQRENNGFFVERNATVLALRGELSHRFGRHRLTVGTNWRSADEKLSFRGLIPLCDKFEQVCGGIFAATLESRSDTFQSTELYVEDQFTASSRVTLDLGLHSAFDHLLNEVSIEPRLGATLSLGEESALYARLGAHHVSPKPEDQLLLGPLAENQESERARHALLGYRWNISDVWRLQTEAWYKETDHTEWIGSPLQRAVDGKAYGLDLLLARPISQKLYGWAALSLSDGTWTDAVSGLEVENRYAQPVSATVAITYAFDNGWALGAKYRTQSGDRFTPLAGVSLDPATNAPILNFGRPFSEQLGDYHRLDVRLEKFVSYRRADVTYYVDVLNVADRPNQAHRTFPLRNATFDTNDAVTIIPREEDGIPFFAAIGINLLF